ncbi:transcription factor bHLH117 [Juglans microcarpa x Juglans regia]|uniref:transcription factor bHLH117 n=1 Tax=Juglans microcarpa x Juglans regia TaxID=2249226 RepID=UPI001B7EF4B7|nr:transcription factor bHLH117 [Juglans microcarpa x Juglans regia]
MKMERGFDTSFAGGEGCEEGSFNSMFSGVSLQSLLTDNTLLPFYADYFPLEDVNSTPTTTTSFPFSFVSEDYPSTHNCHRLGVGGAPLNFNNNEDSVDNKKLKLPKSEPLAYEQFDAESTNAHEPFHFLTNSSVLSHDQLKCSSVFPHLPLLQSLEHSHSQPQPQPKLFPSASVSPSKRLRLDSTTATNSQTLESIVQSCYRYHVPNLNLNLNPPPVVLSSQPAVMPHSKLASRRRQKLSEKTQSLRKLMPWDTKMDMATMLEEAHKYVKFLQAQLKALQTMPSSSSFSAFTPAQSLYSGVFGGLGRLTRNQILQVLVNSPVAQTMLYSQGCCVFATEQMALLGKIAERKLLFQQQNVAFNHSSTSSSSTSRGFFLP